MLDRPPRVLLDPQLGVCTLGRSAGTPAIVHSIYSQRMDNSSCVPRASAVIRRSRRKIFSMSNTGTWSRPSSKKRRQAALFAGEVALVTGARLRHRQGCVESLLACARRSWLDIDPAVANSTSV